MENDDTTMLEADAPEGPDGDATAFMSTDEKRVLELYDRLQSLRLEIALINAHQAYKPNPSASVTDSDIKNAQHALLSSRASYLLRNDVVDSVMTVNPILKAVHNAAKASPIERDLLPFIETRDAASIALAKQSASLRAILDETVQVETEAARISRTNVELAAEVLKLAEEAERKRAEPLEDPRTKAEIEKLKAQLKRSRQIWKGIKGAASGIVVGSGVDWAGDKELREMVLDPE